MARVLIAGCGAVGTALGVMLAARGLEVWGLRRECKLLPVAIKPIQADLNDPGSLANLPKDLTAVYYTASAGGYDPQRYFAAYQSGIGNLISALAAQEQSPKRLFFTSSTSVYGEQAGRWVDEKTPVVSANFAQEALMSGESLVDKSPQSSTVVRFAGIYGPKRTWLLDRVRSGKATCRSDVYSNRIHEHDCARALAHLLTLESPAPLYVAVDDNPAPQCEVMSWLAERLLAPAPRILPATEPDASGRSTSKRCSNRLLRQSGFRFRYPSYRQGYAPLLAGQGVQASAQDNQQ